MSSELTLLRTYAEAHDGLTATAERIGVSKAVLWAWINRGQVPVERCADIERVTGGAVTRRQLRPADWHRIWPELAERAA